MDGTLTTQTLDVGLGLPEVLVEHDGDGTTRYLHLPNGVATDDGTGWSYSAPDGLGSVRQRVDGSGQVVSVDGYWPFGSPLTGDGGAPYGFTGEWSIVPEAKRSGREGDAGLLFLRARYYDPLTGRFLSLDPWRGDVWRPGTLNRFVYVVNNSVNSTDPSGHIDCGPACQNDWIEEWRIDPCTGHSDCQSAWVYGTEQWGQGWTAHDTEVVLFTVLALAGGMAAPEIIAAAPGAIEAVGWKALEWTLCHQTLAKILGFGGTAISQELADADDDEIRAAQQLLNALQESGGRIPLGQLDPTVLTRLQQLGEAAVPTEEFLAILAQDGQMYLIQTSLYGGALPPDTVQWLLHTHYGTGVDPSSFDQLILYALGMKTGQFHFSMILDSQGNLSFFLPFIKDGLVLLEGGG